MEMLKNRALAQDTAATAFVAAEMVDVKSTALSAIFWILQRIFRRLTVLRKQRLTQLQKVI